MTMNHKKKCKINKQLLKRSIIWDYLFWDYLTHLSLVISLLGAKLMTHSIKHLWAIGYIGRLRMRYSDH